MSWLVRGNEEDPIKSFREQLSAPGIIKIPGAHNAMAGLLAKKAGFKTIYLSGAAITASMGMPDLGLITLTELVEKTREIGRATGMPMLIDVDTGYGSIINVTRTVYEMTQAGAAAIQLEDQELPKKCGHLNGKKIVSIKEMSEKIKAARKASPDIVIIARTDSKATEGIESAIDRANAYYEAGADMIFPEALINEKEFVEFSSKVNMPLLANMTEFGRTPFFTAEEFEEMGYKAVIYPVTSLRIAAKAMEIMYETIQKTGSQKDLVEDMQTRQELYDTILYDKYEELDSNIAKTIMNELL